MDRISDLPDELLLKILSSLPVNDVVVTMVLSKRWKPLWMSVPKLKYNDRNLDIEYGPFSRFVHRSLLLHEAPVERLSFKISPRFNAVDIGTWIDLGVTRCLRGLDIVLSYQHMPIRLPESLYTCKTLGYLELSGAAVLVDVRGPVFLPSLVTLFLLDVTYSGEESFHRLLSGCPIVDTLVVRQVEGDNLRTFTVKVPSLLILGISREIEDMQYHNQRVVIDGPSLIWLAITDYNQGLFLIENTPMLETASLDLVSNSIEKLKGSLTSVRQLRFCVLIPKPVYPKGTTFHGLIRLDVCTCTECWLDLLMSLLRDSPKLRLLKLSLDHHLADGPRPVWNKPSSVPRCFASDLKTIEWSNYRGGEEEKELVKFMLRYGSCLKTVSISFDPTTLKQKLRMTPKRKLSMIKEITLLSRASPTCQLFFN